MQPVSQRQVSIDVDGGVLILEVPEKQQNKAWRIMSQYARLFQKYLGLQTVENETKLRAGSVIGESDFIKCLQNRIHSTGPDLDNKLEK